VSLGVVPGDPTWGQGRSSRSSGYRSRTYYLPDDLHFRMRNAWWHTQTQPGGHDSISELVAFALLPVVEELEARYNSGLPFPEIPERRRPKAGPSGRARQAHALRVRASLRQGDLHTGAGVDDAEPEDDPEDLPRDERRERGEGIGPGRSQEARWT
jgi:hypothetical protein